MNPCIDFFNLSGQTWVPQDPRRRQNTVCPGDSIRIKIFHVAHPTDSDNLISKSQLISKRFETLHHVQAGPLDSMSTNTASTSAFPGQSLFPSLISNLCRNRIDRFDGFYPRTHFRNKPYKFLILWKIGDFNNECQGTNF